MPVSFLKAKPPNNAPIILRNFFKKKKLNGASRLLFKKITPNNGPKTGQGNANNGFGPIP